MANVPTVKIKADLPGGHMVINESDFNSEVHERYVEPRRKVVDAKAEGAGGDNKGAPERAKLAS